MHCSGTIVCFSGKSAYEVRPLLPFNLCLLSPYRDATACHIFTGTHRSLIENFILPYVPGPAANLVLVIDDSVYVSGQLEWVEAYDRKYREVMQKLGLGVQEPDQDLRKSFLASTKGEILGYWLNSVDKTWMVAQSKVDDILRQCDKMFSGPTTLKTFQKIQGKMADLGKLSPVIKTKLMVISHELARAAKYFWKQNSLKESDQLLRHWLSGRALEDLTYLRAVTAQIRHHPLPMVDPRPYKPLSGQVVVYVDASGDLDCKAYCGVLITRGSLHPSDIALSYELPSLFLESLDTRGKYNFHNSMLLELLSLLALVTELGPELSGRSVLFVTDSLSLVTLMHNHRVPDGPNTMYALQTLQEAAREIRTEIRVHWKRRRSCLWTKAADDLSHAHHHKLPWKKMPGASFKELFFPPPIQQALLEAAFDPASGFPSLRDKVKNYWNELGWCTRFWHY